MHKSNRISGVQIKLVKTGYIRFWLIDSISCSSAVISEFMMGCSGIFQADAMQKNNNDTFLCQQKCSIVVTKNTLKFVGVGSGKKNI
jgi:hypothetical protein